MRVSIRAAGLEGVLKELNKELLALPRRTKTGLVRAGLLIQREAMQRCPVDTGNLRASAYTVWGSSGRVREPHFVGEQADKALEDHINVTKTADAELSGEIAVEVGFSANYALYVHENTAASHLKHKQRTGIAGKRLVEAVARGEISSDMTTQVGEAKFLEHAVDENRARILQAIKDGAKGTEETR